MSNTPPERQHEFHWEAHPSTLPPACLGVLRYTWHQRGNCPRCSGSRSQEGRRFLEWNLCRGPGDRDIRCCWTCHLKGFLSDDSERSLGTGSSDSSLAITPFVNQGVPVGRYKLWPSLHSTTRGVYFIRCFAKYSDELTDRDRIDGRPRTAQRSHRILGYGIAWLSS